MSEVTGKKTGEEPQGARAKKRATRMTRKLPAAFAIQTCIVLVLTLLALLRPFGAMASWLIGLALILLFAVVAGRSTTGYWLGALIDERNRISLSRLQMLAWSALTLSALGTIAIGRVVEIGQDGFNVGVPETLWVLMGITTTSLVGTPLLNGVKKGTEDGELVTEPNPPPERAGASARKVEVQGQIVRKQTREEASWGDIFDGDDISNYGYLDLGKVQMFFITFVVLLGYAIAIGEALSGDQLPASLPDLGSGMVALLGISHGGYLGSKSIGINRGPTQ